MSQVKSSYITTDGQLVSLSGTHLGPATNFFPSFFTDLVMWDALSDEKSGLWFSFSFSFFFFAGHREPNLSQF
jgi:hypothetical protein